MGTKSNSIQSDPFQSDSIRSNPIQSNPIQSTQFNSIHSIPNEYRQGVIESSSKFLCPINLDLIHSSIPSPSRIYIGVCRSPPSDPQIAFVFSEKKAFGGVCVCVCVRVHHYIPILIIDVVTNQPFFFFF